MPEQKITYQERWQKKANEFSVAHGTSNVGFHRINLYYEKDARICVAAQAEAIREAVRAVNDYDSIDDETILSAVDNWIDTYLLDHGYIESKTEDDAS